MSYPHYDLVQRAHSELVAEGKIKRRTDQDQVEQDKGLLTRRAAYYAFTERDPTHGLMRKTTGNNSLGYSVDCILDQGNGQHWDIATDSGGMALPVDGGPSDPNAADIPRWAQPTAELAQIEDTPGPGPGPTPPPDDQLAEIQATLERMQETQARDTAMIIARDDLNTQRIMDELHRIVEQFEATAQKILVLYLAQRPDDGDGEAPVVPPAGGDGDGLSEIQKLVLKWLLDNRPARRR